MKDKGFLFVLLLLIVLSVVVTQVMASLLNLPSQNLQVESVEAKPVGSEIKADGSVHSENEATLNFPIGGKLTYLPLKEGDKVYIGETIASLDLRTIQANIESTAKSYENQKIAYDIVNDFNGDRDLSDTGLSISARRQLQTAVNTLDSSQLAVEIQKIAQDQSILTSPINGILISEDVKVPNVNISPLTSFSVADPSKPVFKVFVLPQDIDFIQVGSKAKITIDGLPGVTLLGSVEKIYPQKTTLGNGVSGYYVDVSSDNLKNVVTLGQTGTVLIESTAGGVIDLIPSWTIVGYNNVWVLENGKPVLKKIQVGKKHGDMTEIYPLQQGDKIILNPKSVAARNYSIL